MSELTPSNQSVLQALFGPHAEVTRTIDQQRARTLAVLSLFLLVVSAGLLVYILLILREPRGVIGLPFLGLFLASYTLSRTRWAVWGGWLLVFGSAVMDFIVLATAQQLEVVTAVTTFVLLPILFSTVLLDGRWTLILTLLINAGLGIFYAAARWLNFADVIVPFLATLLVSILAAATAFLRERDLDVIRQQQSRLDSYSHDLESQMDQQTMNIAAAADIGRVVATTRDLDAGLRQIVELIVERFKYYYAQVFLIDAGERQAVLKAGSGSAGEELLARGHRLPIGSQSVVGQVTATGNPIVVADTDTDPVHRRNELLPHTRSEVGLPLRAGGRVVGVLNIHSTTPNTFDPSRVTIFQTIADQLGVAIENNRLFERAQRDLEDIEMLNRQLTGDAWRKYFTGRAEGFPVGFTAGEDGVRPLMALPSREGEPPAEGTISMPLKVRGETIGMLDVTPRSGQPPDEQLKGMLEAVAERVALALDSTRVGEQAQRQAQREQILSTISAELQATTDLNVILRAVAKESSHALDAPRSFIHLAMTFAEESKPDESAGSERKELK